MPYGVLIGFVNDDGSSWSVPGSGETLDDAIEDARKKAAAFDRNPDQASDPMQQFICSLPEDVREQFHLPLVLAKHEITSENVLQWDTPHRREFLIREVRDAAMKDW